MKKENITPNKERFVPAQYINENGIIETYPNYVVSNWGRVASMKGKVMKILKSGRLKHGYLQVCFCIDGKTYQRSVHRIVLSSFHPELWTKDTNEVDHLDRDVTNNYLVNLRWTDKNGNNTNRAKCPVMRIRVTYLNDGHIEEFDNMTECSRAFGKHRLWCSEVINRSNGFRKSLSILIEKIP